jgi:hypothetical protein
MGSLNGFVARPPHEPHHLFVAVRGKRWRHNPVGVDRVVGESTQGSLARSATLGFGAQSLWDWANKAARGNTSISFVVPMHSKKPKRGLSMNLRTESARRRGGTAPWRRNPKMIAA